MTECKKINPANLLTVQEFAAREGVKRQTVYFWIKEKKVKKVSFLGKSWIDKSTFNK